MSYSTIEKFNKYHLIYSADGAVKGTISYFVDGQPTQEEFFLAKGENMSFCSFIDGYLDGVLAEGEISIETEFIADGSFVDITSIDTTCEKVYEGGTYFFENDFYKVGVELAWGGGLTVIIDKNAPDKCANIWHLVTVEPDFMIKESAAERAFARLGADKSELHSCDMEVLSRRFDSFMGPNYTTGKIESGIERLTAIKPPFDPDGIERINSEMLFLARDRGRLREEWTAQVAEGGFEVVVETELPREKRVPVFNFSNIFLSFAAVLLELALVSGAAKALNSERTVLAMIIFVLVLLLLKPLSKRLRKMLKHINPARSVKSLGLALYKTLCRCGLIETSAKVETRENEENFSLSIRLRNASVHDQNVFNTAMAELLSPMEEPRYVLIAKSAGAYNYALSYACPTVIGKKKEYVEMLSRQLKSAGLKFEPVYTRSEQGRAVLLKCRKRSYISFNGTVSGKKHVLYK